MDGVGLDPAPAPQSRPEATRTGGGVFDGLLALLFSGAATGQIAPPEGLAGWPAGMRAGEDGASAGKGDRFAAQGRFAPGRFPAPRTSDAAAAALAPQPTAPGPTHGKGPEGAVPAGTASGNARVPAAIADATGEGRVTRAPAGLPTHPDTGPTAGAPDRQDATAASALSGKPPAMPGRELAPHPAPDLRPAAPEAAGPAPMAAGPAPMAAGPSAMEAGAADGSALQPASPSTGALRGPDRASGRGPAPQASAAPPAAVRAPEAAPREGRRVSSGETFAPSQPVDAIGVAPSSPVQGADGPSPATGASGPGPAASGRPLPQVPLAALGPVILRAAARGEQTLLVRIEPPALGQLEIGLRLDPRGRLEVTLRPRRAEALERLEAERPALERLLAAHGEGGATVRLELADGDGREGRAGRHGREHRPASGAFARVLDGLVDVRI